MEIIVDLEKELSGYFAYAENTPGIIVGFGRTKEEALSDLESGLKFTIQTSKELGRDTYKDYENGFTLKEKTN